MVRRYELALDKHFDFVQCMKTTKWQENTARFAVAAGSPAAWQNEHTGQTRTLPDYVTPVMMPSSKEVVTVRRDAMDDPETMLKLGKGIEKFMSPLIAGAETFFVTSAMVQRWREIEMPPGFVLEPWHLLTDSGFVWFEEEATMMMDGLDYSSRYSQEWVPIRGMFWHVRPDLPNRVGVGWFIDSSSRRWAESLRDSWVNNALRKAEEAGMPLPEPIVVPDDIVDALTSYTTDKPRFIVDSYGVFPFGTPWDQWGETSGHALALWLLMQHKKSRLGIATASRAVRRRAKDLPKAGDINVIYLRREVARDPDLAEALGYDIEDGRLRPRRHRVRKHWQRYHTREGIVWRKRESFERGGEPGERIIETDPMFVLKR